MPRSRRIQIPGLPQHVIQRGNNRIDIFRSPRDFDFFLDGLYEVSTGHELDIHSYVMMTNHIHIVMTAHSATALADAMRANGSRYVGYFNRKYSRTGTLYNGRHRSLVIESETYCFTCMRYVELNPVRAGLVTRPEEYRWSSYHANALGIPDKLITPHPLYLSLGSSAAIRQQAWREICAEPLSTQQLTDIRDHVHRGGILRKVAAIVDRNDQELPTGTTG
jgi:putative transposase